MSDKKIPLWRIYGISWTITALLFAFVGIKAGLAALLVVIILAGIEVTFSFDNAVVNAKILQRMSPFWQRMFLTVGILIAVFGVRVFLPIFIVAATASIGVREVTDLALNHPAEYSEKLEVAHPMITAFGGIFLLMIFLDFMFMERKIKWLKRIEDLFIRVGKFQRISVVIGVAAILTATYGLAHEGDRMNVLSAGTIGLMVYLAINALDAMFSYEKLDGSHGPSPIAVAAKGGFASFLYLELIDASFSLDGVIGAFAITDSILLIAVGLGIGAIYVRSLTVHMLRNGMLHKYVYMEHGAHYAIGILAALMLASLKFHIPEVISGLAGVTVIVAALIHSHREAKANQ